MPTFRTVPAARGAAWLVEGLLGLRRSPGPFLLACALISLLRLFPFFGAFLGLLMPLFYAGLASLLRVRAEGGIGRPMQAYDGFVLPGAMARLAPITAFNVLFVMAVAAFLVYAAGPAFAAAMESSRATGQPQRAEVEVLVAQLSTPLLLIAPVALFVAWVQMLAIPRAMLHGVPGGTALREAVAAVFANLGAFLVNLSCLVVLGFGAMLAGALAMMVAQLTVGLVPSLAWLVQMAIAICLLSLVHALYAVVMFQAAGEVFDAAVGPPPPMDAIEA